MIPRNGLRASLRRAGSVFLGERPSSYRKEAMRRLPLIPPFPLLAPRRSFPYRRVFDQPRKMACDGIIGAKSILLLSLVSLLSMFLLACAGSGGSSNGGIGYTGKSSAHLELLPDDIKALQGLKVNEFWRRRSQELR